MRRRNLSKTFNHQAWAITQDANDHTIHATLQRNHLFTAIKKCIEVWEITKCIVANGIVAAALEDCQHANNFNTPMRPGAALDKGHPIRYKETKSAMLVKDWGERVARG